MTLCCCSRLQAGARGAKCRRSVVQFSSYRKSLAHPGFSVTLFMMRLQLTSIAQREAEICPNQSEDAQSLERL